MELTIEKKFKLPDVSLTPLGRRVVNTLAAERRNPGMAVGRAGIRVGRNDRCPCGSGKKFKKCHAAPPKPPAPKVEKAKVA